MLKRNDPISRYLFKLVLLTSTILVFGCKSNMNQNDFNNGFEVKPEQYGDSNSWLATRVPQTKDFVVFAWDSTEYHSGSYSVSIAIDSMHPQDLIAYNWTRTFADFIIGKQYSISGWIRTKNLNETAWIVVQCWDKNQKLIGFYTNQNSHPVKGTSDWTLVKTAFIVPDYTKEVRIRAGIASPKNNGGKVWFDDIQIE